MAQWSSDLLTWYHAHKRAMPWRTTPSPYRIWVSEIMLQQTQVDTVIPYFNRFLRTFPSIKKLAQADTQDVLKAWEGLGYYSRARNLQKAALQITQTGGRIPRNFEDLQTLPGIGPYCAAAIASIAFGEPVPVVDGNVFRVFTRFWGIHDDITKPATRSVLFSRLSPHVKNHNPADFNQAIMELGALVCRPTNPDCTNCPLKPRCIARKNKLTGILPVKKKKASTPHHAIGVGIIWKKDTLLIARRADNKMLGGLWEFPGGKQEPRETLRETVLREVREETALEVSIGDCYQPIKHTYSHFSITMTAYDCTYTAGRISRKGRPPCKWVHAKKLSDFPFPTANKKLIDQIWSRHLSAVGS